jgi:hypothetical protein
MHQGWQKLTGHTTRAALDAARLRVAATYDAIQEVLQALRDAPDGGAPCPERTELSALLVQAGRMRNWIDNDLLPFERYASRRETHQAYREAHKVERREYDAGRVKTPEQRARKAAYDAARRSPT